MKTFPRLPKFVLLLAVVALILLSFSCSISNRTLKPEADAEKTLIKIFDMLNEYITVAERVVADSVISDDEAKALNAITVEINAAGDAFAARHNDDKLLENTLSRMAEKPKYADILSKLLEVSMSLFECKGFELLEN